ncbi:50S ribosomal protein L13 [Marispirochaeta sp.]|jgi:large subunit ribosomal protein L13|uniref:50S ribosomal protein L13 n=1 Tax=Marispirochaeta sp. TaxID=2038653 RepID=UPI0029C78CA3|nr:50S ribosomal protein L13 [Marispirochaeta sp.]
MKTIFVKPSKVERKWYLIDAAGKRLGRVATEVVRLLRGKNRPYYTPHQEIGDYVVIINADKVEVTGNKAQRKIYYRHTGYPGGIKSETFSDLIARKPAAPLEKAIKGMLPKGPLGRQLFRNVKVYAGPNHPHSAQQPEILK